MRKFVKKDKIPPENLNDFSEKLFAKIFSRNLLSVKVKVKVNVRINYSLFILILNFLFCFFYMLLNWYLSIKLFLIVKQIIKCFYKIMLILTKWWLWYLFNKCALDTSTATFNNWLSFTSSTFKSLMISQIKYLVKK